MYPLLGYDEAIQDFYPLGYRLWLWCPGAIHQNRGQNRSEDSSECLQRIQRC